MEEFQLNKFTREGAQLLREVTTEFNRLGLDASRLPKTFPDDNDKIKLVFVGQFGAGKSSLIKMLTGADVEIGAGITTQTAASYEWDGLELVDTPGIHTELRPDHDKITYDQINRAALLIFVITNEGFSQRMGDHFRELAVKQKRAANMVLVVNKMGRTAQGNVPEQQQIIYADLKKVTTPYDPKELYVSFTDAESYFKALAETDERRKNRRLERSGRENFIANLNRFVADKGILQKINAPLNTIAAEIRNAQGSSSDAQKSDLEAWAAIFRRCQKIVLYGKQECNDDIEDLIAGFKAKVSQRGRTAAESALSQETEDDAQKVLDAAQEKVKTFADDCEQEIAKRIKNFIEQTQIELQDYDNSSHVQKVRANIAKYSNAQGSTESSQRALVVSKGGAVDTVDAAKIFGGQNNDAQTNDSRKLKSISTRVNAPGSSTFVQGSAAVLGTGGAATGALIAQYGPQFFAPLAKVGITPLGEAVGNAVSFGVSWGLKATGGGTIFSGVAGLGAGELVTRIPIFKADPTLMNKFASLFTGNGSKIFGAAMAGVTTFISLAMIHHESEKAEELERELRAKRNEIITVFTDYADDCARELSNKVRDFMAQNVEPLIENFGARINAVKAVTVNNNATNEKLSRLLKQTENLIGDIQAAG